MKAVARKIRRLAYISKVSQFSKADQIIRVLTGLRRCGKSTILSQYADEAQVPYTLIDMEDLSFDEIQNYSDLNCYVLKNCSEDDLLLIDEVQEIDQWEKAIASLNKRHKIVITGSNARLLSGELATKLTGRYVEISVFPLTYSEYLEFRSTSSNKELFFEYLKYGGLPGIHHLEFSEEVIHQYLSAILSSILLKDVVARYSVRNADLLERLLKFLYANVGNLTTAKSISDYLKNQKIKASVDTIQSYLSYLSDAFLVHKVSRYDIKGKKHLEISEKYYAGDLGLIFSMLSFSPDRLPGLLENCVYLELVARGFKVSVGKVDEYEVDFIAEKGDTRAYYQVCYLLNSDAVIEREFGSLERVKNHYPKYVLSMDDMGNFNRGGIIHKNIIDFLKPQVPGS